jgi:hypothetical protein
LSFSVLLAGLFAYMLGCMIFAVYFIMVKIIKSKYWHTNLLFVLLISMGFCIAIYPFIKAQIKQKSIQSNVVRMEQVKTLLSENIITGNGLGNYIKINTSTRAYNGDLYFELQSLYIINQIGVIGYILFMVCTIYIFYKQNRKMLPIYLIYLFYSFWNPYCFDTTHMMTAILLINTRSKIVYL